jgi:hypothetical protein
LDGDDGAIERAKIASRKPPPLPRRRKPRPQVVELLSRGISRRERATFIVRCLLGAGYSWARIVRTADMSSNGVVFALGLMAVITLIGGWAYYRVLAGLKLRHDLVWEDLGRPEISNAQSMLVQLRFMQFLFLRRYAKLHDRKICILGDVLLACWAMKLGLLLFVLSIGCADLRACFAR